MLAELSGAQDVDGRRGSSSRSARCAGTCRSPSASRPRSSRRTSTSGWRTSGPAQRRARPADELSVGDIDVRASISASVTDLSPAAAALFARLGVPSGDWPGWVPRCSWRGGLAAGSPGARRAHRPAPRRADRTGYGGTASLPRAQPRRRARPRAPGQHRGSRTRDALAIDSPGMARPHRRRRRPAGPRRSPGPTTRRPTTTPAARACVGAARRLVRGRADQPHRRRPRGVARDDRELAARIALAIRTFLTIRAYDDERERVLRIALDDYPEEADQRLSPSCSPPSSASSPRSTATTSCPTSRDASSTRLGASATDPSSSARCRSLGGRPWCDGTSRPRWAGTRRQPSWPSLAMTARRDHRRCPPRRAPAQHGATRRG